MSMMNRNDSRLRVGDPGRLSKPTLIKRIAKQVAQQKLRSRRAALGSKRDFNILPKEWAAPDSGPAKQAERLAALLNTPIVSARSSLPGAD